MFPINQLTPAAHFIPPKPPSKATADLTEKLDEIAKEISIIESNYLRLMELEDEPEKYTEGTVFHSVWLYDLYLELRGFLGSSEESALVPALMIDQKEAERIESLIARTDEMPGLFPEAVNSDISRFPESFVSGFRQEAIKTQLACQMLQKMHFEINEHNIYVSHVGFCVTSIIMNGLEANLKQIGFAVDQVRKALDQLPAVGEAQANKYLELMELNAERVVTAAKCIFAVIAKSLPPMNLKDVSDPSKIGHKSQLDQRLARFYQKKQKLTQLACNLQQELSDRRSSKPSSAAGSAGRRYVGGLGTERKRPEPLALLISEPPI